MENNQELVLRPSDVGEPGFCLPPLDLPHVAQGGTALSSNQVEKAKPLPLNTASKLYVNFHSPHLVTWLVLQPCCREGDWEMVALE